MLIVIEGVDLTGKTTLANRLAELAPGTTVVHAAKPTQHPLGEYEAVLDDFNPRYHKTIRDRFHMGERVWPEIFGRASDYTPEMFRHTELFLQSRGALTIYAEREPTILGVELDRADDEPLTSASLHTAMLLYEILIQEAAQEVWRYDYMTCGGLYLDQLLEEAEDRALDASDIFLLTSEFIGNPRAPRVLLVGDEFGPDRDRPAARVPFVPYKNTSGHFLMSALGEVDWWRDTIVVNATKGNGTDERLPELWELLERPAIVALGRKAEAKLAAYNLPFTAVPHPQYSRRFEKSRGGAVDYACRLDEAVGSQLQTREDRL